MLTYLVLICCSLAGVAIAIECPMGKVHAPPCGTLPTDQLDENCVHIKECLQKIECPAGRIPAECKPCDVTCEDYRKPCPLICEVGLFCACPPGQVAKSPDNDTCVDVSTCTSLADQELQCPEGKVKSPPCGVCPSTCENPTNICPAICNMEETCVCAPGTLPRSDVDNTCVSVIECVDNLQCRSDQVATTCKPCDVTCENLNEPCLFKCELGLFCDCPDGQVRKSRENPKCVSVSSCETALGGDEDE